MPTAPMVGAAGAVAAAAAATAWAQPSSDTPAPNAEVAQTAWSPAPAPVAAPAYAPAAAPAVAMAPPAPAPALAPAAAPTPAPAVVPAYVLPADALQSVATSVGLEWVNSDADKMRAVQAAMAAEPKPVHVPRAPVAAVVVDEGPLVLVETRRDLSQLKLPFEMQNKA
jgi:ribonuclease E